MNTREYFRMLARDEAKQCIDQNAIIAGIINAMTELIKKVGEPDLYLADGYDYASMLSILADITPKITGKTIGDVDEVFADKFGVDAQAD